MKKNTLLIFILILLSLPSIISLFRPGFFQSDDGEWMIIRFSAFHKAFRDGQFPVRFLGRLNYEYGYPVANFLYPGFMYLAEIPKILGFGFVNSIKIILGLSMVASAVFSFLWLRKFFGRWEALVGSFFYLYAPYHLFDLYKRGSVGEVLALAIVPFILWMIEKKSLVFTSLGIAFLILAHNTLALLFLPIILGYMILDYYLTRQLKIYWYIGILVLGLGMASFFWIPAISDLSYTRFSQTSVSQWNNYFVNQELIGLPTIFIFLLIFVLFIIQKIKLSKHRLTLLLFVFGLISLFFSTSLSAPLWSILPVSFIQFPFRFLSVTILSVAFLAACALSVLSKKLKIVAGLIILLLVIISSRPFITPSQFFDKGEGFYATNEGTTTVQNEYMPKWVKVKPIERFKERVEIIEGNAKIANLTFNSKKTIFDVSSLSDSKIRVNTVYFPGWKAFIDGEESVIHYNNDLGVMDLSVPKGEHKIRFTFTETPLRLFVDIISIVSFFVLILSIKIKRSSISRFIC